MEHNGLAKPNERAVIPDKPFINEGAIARRQIVLTAGELVGQHPDKFRVVFFHPGEHGTQLDVSTTLVYDDGELTLRLNIEGGEGRLEQHLYVIDGRETIYRLDITREMHEQQERFHDAKSRAKGTDKRSRFYRALMEDWDTSSQDDNPPLLTDSFAQTKVPTEAISVLLQCHSDLKLPDVPLGMIYAPTLQEFLESVRRSRGPERPSGDKALLPSE